MKVLNLTQDDFSNFSYWNSEALRSVGVNCESVKTIPHAFEYANQSRVLTPKQIRNKISEADIIQIMHSDQWALSQCKGKYKRLVVYHTGTKYRQNTAHYNDLFNGVVDISFTDQTEFVGLGMKNEHYIATAIDTDALIPRKSLGDKLVIGHFPSNSVTKGTSKIIEMMQPHLSRCEFVVDTRIVSHDKNIQRIQQCDVYIELFAPEQNGKPYGCFGVTAFEAASMGKIVLTQNLNQHIYQQTYGDQIFLCAETEEHFKNNIEFLLSHRHHIKPMQELHREMMVKRHSLKATGERLKKILNL